MFKSITNAALSVFGLKLVRAGSVHFAPGSIPWGVDLWADVRRLAGDRPVRRVFDVGANEGQFAGACAGAFPAAEVWSFEPVPDTFARLQAGASAAGPRVKPFCLGLGERDETRTIKLYPHSTMNSLADRPAFEDAHSPPIGEIPVAVRSLDSFCREHQVTAIDLLKVDTEGYDLSVFRGGVGLLGSAAVRFLTTEFYRPLPIPGRVGGGLSEVTEFLAGYGFEFVAAYTDYVLPEKRYFGVHNALFASTR
jgi:FkbM family methyltransferase